MKNYSEMKFLTKSSVKEMLLAWLNLMICRLKKNDKTVQVSYDLKQNILESKMTQ